jgi:hypothetical protein
VLIGFDIELVCALSCVSPPVPHQKCPSFQNSRCTNFVSECPAATDTSTEARGACRFLLEPFAPVPFAAIFFGDRVKLAGDFYWEGYLAPIILGSKFLPDTSGVTIELDTPSNRARYIGGKISSSKVYLNAERLFGSGAFVSFILPHRMTVYFGNGPTMGEGTFLEARAYTIAAAEPNRFKYLAGTTAPEALAPQDRPRPMAKIEVPSQASSCRDIVVNAASSNLGGCRPLEYFWGARVSKCIDVNCINSVEMFPKSQLWLLTAQRDLYNFKSEKVTASRIFASGSQELNIVGANKFIWLLQTTNWLFRDFVYNPDGHVSCLPTSTSDPRCNFCRDKDYRVCPGVSVITATATRFHASPLPEVQFQQPRYEEVDYGDVKMFAEIVVPSPEETSLDYCPGSPQLYFKASDREDVAIAYSTVRVNWKVEELAMVHAENDISFFSSLSGMEDGMLFTTQSILTQRFGEDLDVAILTVIPDPYLP